MYKKAMLFFSQDLASIATVIPAMDKLDTHLNPCTQQSYHPAILAAMKLARNKINQYYSMTDLLSLYRIAMGKYCTSLSSLCLSADVYFSPSSRT
jgi:hypothetical protein